MKQKVERKLAEIYIQEIVDEVVEKVVASNDKDLPMARVFAVDSLAVKHPVMSPIVPYADLKAYIEAHVEGKTADVFFDKDIGR